MTRCGRGHVGYSFQIESSGFAIDEVREAHDIVCSVLEMKSQIASAGLRDVIDSDSEPIPVPWLLVRRPSYVIQRGGAFHL